MSRHEECGICQHIPDVSREFVVGGEMDGEGLPRQEAQLLIVGAPYFNDDRVSSRTLLKKCPECGTFYEWDYEYEYLAGGSEDDVTLTRLIDEEGQRRENDILSSLPGTPS